MKPIYNNKIVAKYSFDMWENSRCRRGMDAAVKEDRWIKRFTSKYARRKLRELLRNCEFDSV